MPNSSALTETCANACVETPNRSEYSPHFPLVRRQVGRVPLRLKETQMSREQAGLLLVLLEQAPHIWLPTGKLAVRLEVGASSVVNLLCRLEQKNWVCRKPYQGSRLTEEGRCRACQLRQTELLWSMVLHQILLLPWPEAQQEAQQLRGFTSPNLVRYLWDWQQRTSNNVAGQL